MKRINTLVFIPVLAFLAAYSCREEDRCDTTDYALPEISILDPVDGVIIWTWDGPPAELTIDLKAEAGLNVLSLENAYGDVIPMYAFTDGETALEFKFIPEHFFDEGEAELILYDLCNQSARIKIQLVFGEPPSN